MTTITIHVHDETVHGRTATSETGETTVPASATIRSDTNTQRRFHHG